MSGCHNYEKKRCEDKHFSVIDKRMVARALWYGHGPTKADLRP